MNMPGNGPSGLDTEKLQEYLKTLPEDQMASLMKEINTMTAPDGTVQKGEDGVEWTVTRPKSHFVVKGWAEEGKKKVFVNMCSSDHVDPPGPIKVQDEETGQWEERMRIPVSAGNARVTQDKAGNSAVVFDVTFNTASMKAALEDLEMKKQCATIALFSLQSKEKTINLEKFVFVKGVTNKGGEPEVQRVRHAPKQRVQEIEPEEPAPAKKPAAKGEKKPFEPVYKPEEPKNEKPKPKGKVQVEKAEPKRPRIEEVDTRESLKAPQTEGEEEEEGEQGEEGEEVVGEKATQKQPTLMDVVEKAQRERQGRKCAAELLKEEESKSNEGYSRTYVGHNPKVAEEVYGLQFNNRWAFSLELD